MLERDFSGIIKRNRSLNRSSVGDCRTYAPPSPVASSNLSEPSVESVLATSPSTKGFYERRSQEIHHRFSDEQVVAALLETDDIAQQAAFLHYLAEKKGLQVLELRRC